MNDISLDIVLISGFRPNELRSCLATLKTALQMASDILPPKSVRINIGLNGIAEDQRNTYQSIIDSFELATVGELCLLSFARMPVGAARNRLLDVADGRWVFFCDDDVEIPPTLFTDWFRLCEQNKACFLMGGPNLTPAGASRIEKLQGAVLGTLLGGGPFRRRYSKEGSASMVSSSSLTLCNLFARRGLNHSLRVRFPEDAIGGEELEFISKFPRPFFWSADLHVFHRRRPTIDAFFRQVIKYGVGRSHVRPWQAMLGLIGLMSGALALILATAIGHMDSRWLLGSVFAYVFFIGTNSLLICRREHMRSEFPTAFLLHLVVHLGYVIGLASGLLPDSRRLKKVRE